MSVTRGFLVTVEGGEGCGKSTLLQGLAKKLSDEGRTVLLTREPGGTPLAESVRKLVLDPPEGDVWSPLAEALLMNAARSDYVQKKILPALQRGEWVLCDRYSDSTLVYQGVGGVSPNVLKAMQAEVTREARPDLTLILDASPEDLLQRRINRATSDVFENRPREFHDAVRNAFLKIAKTNPERCVVLDAMLSPKALVEAAFVTIEERLAVS